MAAPVITSKLTLRVLVNVTIHYTIKATESPYAFDVHNAVPQMSWNLTTGRIGGQIRVAGVYTVQITATNDDGTGTANLVITAEDFGIPPPDGLGITVYQSKYWSNNQLDKRIDYADLDSAGQPLCSLDSNSIGAAQMSADAIANKITNIGGPGVIGKYVFPSDRTLIIPSNTYVELGSVDVPGISAGDIVVAGERMLADGILPAIYKTVYYGWAEDNRVRLFGYFTLAGPYTLEKDSEINFRVFTF